MYATNPWGNDPSYQIGPTIWTAAHFNQFAPTTGWRFVRQGWGSGTLVSGATYITLAEGDGESGHRRGAGERSTRTSESSGGGNFSIIIDCFLLRSESVQASFVDTGFATRGSLCI
jgi:hypothetical protein